MTPEVIAALATAITAIISAIAGLYVAMRTGKTAANIAHSAVQAEMVSHYYHDHISSADMVSAYPKEITDAANNPPETPDAA